MTDDENPDLDLECQSDESDEDPGYVYPVFVVTPVPVSLLDAFFEANTEWFVCFELIRSRSSFEKILATRKNKTFVLGGTEPPVSFDPLDPSTEESREDSFIGATLYEIAAFVESTFVPIPDVVQWQHFIVIDQDTLRDGSVIMAELADEFDPCLASEPVEYDAHSLRIMERTSRRVKPMMGSRRDGQREIDATRVGMAYAHCAHTIDFTSCEIDTLRLSSALDGVYWGSGFSEKDPPPIEDRLWIGSTINLINLQLQ